MKKLQTNTNVLQKIDYFLPIIVTVAMAIIFSILTGGRFCTAKNFDLMINQALAIGTVATGAVLIFSSGNMNIAMGGATAIASIAGGFVFLHTNSVAAMMLGCIAAGLLFMILCCILSIVFKVSIVVITIVFMTLLSALQEWLVGKNALSVGYEAMKPLADAKIPLILCVGFFIVCLILFEYTAFGRSLKFIGENKDCARQTGMSETLMVVLAFLIAGVGIGFGGFSTLVRASTVTKTTASSMNMDIMLAIVLAGTPIMGGAKSKVFSGILGALMITMINSGLLMVGVDALYIQAVRGVFFIVMVALSEKKSELLH